MVLYAHGPGTGRFRLQVSQHYGRKQYGQRRRLSGEAMLVAGDNGAKKPVVMELVGKLGFESVDAGPLKNARLLEPFAMVWIDQAMKRGRGRDFAFALVRRGD
jgi:predicted dinucleotide-binding enzyme